MLREISDEFSALFPYMYDDREDVVNILARHHSDTFGCVSYIIWIFSCLIVLVPPIKKKSGLWYHYLVDVVHITTPSSF